MIILLLVAAAFVKPAAGGPALAAFCTAACAAALAACHAACGPGTSNLKFCQKKIIARCCCVFNLK